jgi:hypothetical protein
VEICPIHLLCRRSRSRSIVRNALLYRTFSTVFATLANDYAVTLCAVGAGAGGQLCYNLSLSLSAIHVARYARMAALHVVTTLSLVKTINECVFHFFF